MEHIEITLNAGNDSGEQELTFTKCDDGRFWATLVGNYRGSSVQIDFDDMTRGEIEDMRAALDLLLE